MIAESWELLDRFKDYGNPRTKLARVVKSGQWIPIRRGLYVDDLRMNPLILASVIYGPSYISFQKALEWHGLIPERVPVITCATYGKNRNKKHVTPLGTFTYTDIPPGAYPMGVDALQDGEFHFLMASPAKALCDLVYKAPPLGSLSNITDLLLEDWRMVESDLEKIPAQDVEDLAPLYKKNNLTLLVRFMRSLT